MARKTRRLRKKGHKGGFYPSAYAGIEGAKFLAPLALRQAYRLWNDKTLRRRKTRKQQRKQSSK